MAKFNSETAKKAKEKAAPRGPNKVNRAVKDVMGDVFTQLQEEKEAIEKKANLKAWAIDNPTEFYKLASKLIPVQVGGDPENPLNLNLTTEQIKQKAQEIIKRHGNK
jgi:hypothetical protein